MRSKSTLGWIGLALLGVVIAAAVAVAGAGLVSRQIGLSSEPIDAGDALVPASVGKSRGKGGREKTNPATPPETTVTTPQEAAPPETTVTPPETTTPPPQTASPHEGGEDRGGGGHSGDGGGGHGADD